MQISVALILFAALNVAYVTPAQQNINSNDVYDVHNVNKDAGPGSGIEGENYGSVDFVPWAEANDVKYELEQFSAARRKRAAPLVGVAVRVGVAVAKGLKKAYDASKAAKKAKDAANAAKKGEKALEKVLKDTKPSGSNKRKTTFEHKAQNVKDPFKDANKRFDSVKPKDVKPLSGDKVKGRTGKVGDRTITVRDKSTSGEKSPTVEIFKTNQKRRITHKVRHEKPKETPKPSSGKKSGGGWWGGGSKKKSSGSSSSSGKSKSSGSKSSGRGGGWWRRKRSTH